MLWIAIAFIVAMMIGFLIPRKPLKLDLGSRGKVGLPPVKDPFAAPATPHTKSDGASQPTE